MTIVPFEDSPPLSDTVTPYDERHFVTYLRLLDAADEGADWTEAVQIVFGIDPALLGWTAPNGIAMCQSECVARLNQGSRPWSKLPA
ncbi:hypothetical protein [Novosphingobium sp. LASN5T]|uniref:hypothetical protein n=1 Tax=Novosphingobium sp. LASN5T TaxID=2491021 RepID=UPI001681571B|nr:hypothetical protein [Novosphingobium sp. LASN5T]